MDRRTYLGGSMTSPLGGNVTSPSIFKPPAIIFRRWTQIRIADAFDVLKLRGDMRFSREKRGYMPEKWPKICNIPPQFYRTSHIPPERLLHEAKHLGEPGTGQELYLTHDHTEHDVDKFSRHITHAHHAATCVHRQVAQTRTRQGPLRHITGTSLQVNKRNYLVTPRHRLIFRPQLPRRHTGPHNPRVLFPFRYSHLLHQQKCKEILNYCFRY